MKKIVILGGARDYHAMDWYRTVKKNTLENKVIFLTDLIEGEGYNNLIMSTDNIEKLFIIDNFLFSKQSKFANIWRNFFKLLILPLQIYHLKRYAKNNPNAVYHAHPMYYMLLSWLSGVEFIGTPQGSEILIRAQKSKIYKFFAKKLLKAAKYVTVDSVGMQDKIFELSGVKAIVVQNGIDMNELFKYMQKVTKKDKIVSLRGMTNLYRINKIVDSRNVSIYKTPITFIYPFHEESYRDYVKKNFKQYDSDLGRLNKEQMYELLSETKLVISIPKSDSSPRSVYESIFLGACVAIAYNPYFDVLPQCMKERIYIIDLNKKNWFDDAIEFANIVAKKKYIPTQAAMNMFDQNISIKNVIKKLYY